MAVPLATFCGTAYVFRNAVAAGLVSIIYDTGTVVIIDDDLYMLAGSPAGNTDIDGSIMRCSCRFLIVGVAVCRAGAGTG